MNTYTPNKKEMSFIKKNFETMELFCSYCSDFLLLNNMRNGFVDDNSAYHKSTTKGQDGITTGIVLDVEFDKEKQAFTITALAEGERHFTVTDFATKENILMTAEKIRKNPGKWNEEEIENFKFLHFKPFVLMINDGEISLIKPLDPSLYQEALVLADRLLEEGYLEFGDYEA